MHHYPFYPQGKLPMGHFAPAKALSCQEGQRTFVATLESAVVWLACLNLGGVMVKALR
jgi:hypothetical protein